MPQPISIPSDEFTALAARWRDLLRQSQTRALTGRDYDEWRRVEDDCRAAILATPAQSALTAPFTLDADIPNIDFVHTHELFVSRSLNFAWVEPGTPSPSVLDHPDDHGSFFYRCDLLFLAWVRGRAKLAYEKNRPLSPDEQLLINRVWSYACARAGIEDDRRDLVPLPSNDLVE